MIKYIGEVIGILSGSIGAFGALNQSNELAVFWAVCCVIWTVMALMWHMKATEGRRQ